MKKRYLAGIALGAIAGVALGLRTVQGARSHARAAELAASFVDPMTRQPYSTVPKLVPVAPNAVADPMGPDYDPVKTMDLTLFPADALFVVEPRDPVWATKMEDRLRSIAVKDVESLPNTTAKVKNVECRRMSCNIVITADKPEDLRQADLRLQYTPLGNVQSSSAALGDKTAKESVGFVIVFRPGERDVDERNKTYPSDRKAWLAKRRAQMQAGQFLPGAPPVPEE